MQKTVVTVISAAASLVLVAGTLAPVIYGATNTVGESCVVRTDILSGEAFTLDPLSGGVSGSTSIFYPAGTILVDPSVSGVSGTQTNDWGLMCSFAFIKSITNLIFLIVGVISVALIAYAAFLFIFEGASPQKESQARTALLAAIVGLVVALLAKLIPTIAISLLGVSH